MSYLKKACGNCGQAVIGTCGPCTREAGQRFDKTRPSSQDRGYTPEWRMTRLRAFLRDSWTCVDCGWKPDLVEQYRTFRLHVLPPTSAILEELRARKLNGQRHLHGDHILTIKNRPDLRLTLDNIATRCNVCHASKTAKEDGGFGTSKESAI